MLFCLPGSLNVTTKLRKLHLEGKCRLWEFCCCWGICSNALSMPLDIEFNFFFSYVQQRIYTLATCSLTYVIARQETRIEKIEEKTCIESKAKHTKHVAEKSIILSHTESILQISIGIKRYFFFNSLSSPSATFTRVFFFFHFNFFHSWFVNDSARKKKFLHRKILRLMIKFRRE
jgi:hypothetical protein